VGEIAGSNPVVPTIFSRVSLVACKIKTLSEADKMKRIVAFALLAAVLPPLTDRAQENPRPCPTPEAARDTKFAPGQVWEYKTREHEKSSTLTILKIESLPRVGTIIHVRVDGVRLRNCTDGPEPDKFEHMPFSRDAVGRSVTKMLKEGKVPDFRDGYDEWRKACGGVYTITVAEAVEVGEEAFRKNLGCGPA
jgi:hypothetical protein